MNKLLKEVIEHAERWPLEDQQELAEYARESRHAGPVSTRCRIKSAQPSGRDWQKPIRGSSWRRSALLKLTSVMRDESTLHSHGIFRS
jgi:hypothetical protein